MGKQCQERKTTSFWREREKGRESERGERERGERESKNALSDLEFLPLF